MIGLHEPDEHQVALAAVPTLVAGLYGMNFDNIPLEHWEWATPLL